MGTGTAPVTGTDNFRHRDNFIPTSTKRVTKRLHSSQGQHPWQLQVTHLSYSQSESEQIWLQNKFEDSWSWKNISIQFRFFFKVGVTYRRLACEQALLFGRVKRRVSRERPSERRSHQGQRKGKRPFFGMSRNVLTLRDKPKNGRCEGDYTYNHTEKLIVVVVALLSATKRLWNGKLQIENFRCLEL